jgi:hypothetical protein
VLPQCFMSSKPLIKSRVGDVMNIDRVLALIVGHFNIRLK